MRKIYGLETIIILFALFSNITSQIVKPNATNANTWQNASGISWAFGCNFIGHDLNSFASANATNCTLTCKLNSSCTHFVWTRLANFKGSCQLKYGPVAKSLAFFSPSYKTTCGIIIDEFNGNLSKWKYVVGPGNPKYNELQYYTPNNTQIQNGYLTITLKKEEIGFNSYTSSRLYSETNFRRGIFEARIKLSPGRGTWPAFWLQSAVPKQNWPSNGEMDILEEWGCRPQVIASRVHTTYLFPSGGMGGKKLVPTAYTKFHTYRIDWNSTRLLFYVDNILIFTYNKTSDTKDKWPFDGPFRVVLNLAYTDKILCKNGVDDRFLPATYVIDYVRQFGPGANTKLNPVDFKKWFSTSSASEKFIWIRCHLILAFAIFYLSLNY